MSPRMDWSKGPRELLELPRIQQSVYSYLDLEAGTRGDCAPSQTEIAGAVGAGRRWVNIAIQGLVEADLISVAVAGRGRRYFIHNRGVQAPSRGPQLALDNGSPEPVNSRPIHHTSTPPQGINERPIGHTSAVNVGPLHHTSEIGTSFPSREEEEVKDLPGTSSSFDPDPDAREKPRCPEHGVEGLASKFTDGEFIHRMPDGSWHPFVPGLVAAADPYAHVYRRGLD